MNAIQGGLPVRKIVTAAFDEFCAVRGLGKHRGLRLEEQLRVVGLFERELDRRRRILAGAAAQLKKERI